MLFKEKEYHLFSKNCSLAYAVLNVPGDKSTCKRLSKLFKIHFKTITLVLKNVRLLLPKVGGTKEG